MSSFETSLPDDELGEILLAVEESTKAVMPLLWGRSDKRALWLNAVGIALCRLDGVRRTRALELAQKWRKEQPVRMAFFDVWITLLQPDEEDHLDAVLEPTPDNQQLRSVTPLGAAISVKEHRAAVRHFQKNHAHEPVTAPSH